VQNVIPMENATSALKLTTASYWRPSGKNIHRFPDSKETDEWGVKPDPGFEVPLKDDERLAYLLDRRDRDIVHGKTGPVAENQEKRTAAKKEGGKKQKDAKPFEDKVLNKALDYLRGEIRKVRAARAGAAANS
jgi:carboxyl-terminal processing protease